MSIHRKFILACCALLTALSLTGCNTVEGVGEDLQAGGAAVEDAANSNR